MILQNIKEAIPARSSVLHHATLVCHSFMQTGTTIDTFLLNNLEWLKRASNWARFSATAAQGAVHKGHVREAMRVLEPYLPRVRACVGPAPPLLLHPPPAHRNQLPCWESLRPLYVFSLRTVTPPSHTRPPLPRRGGRVLTVRLHLHPCCGSTRTCTALC